MLKMDFFAKTFAPCPRYISQALCIQNIFKKVHTPSLKKKICIMYIKCTVYEYVHCTSDHYCTLKCTLGKWMFKCKVFS